MRAAPRQRLAHGAGIVHFAASFGFSIACLVALRSGSRSTTEEAFSVFGTLYAITALLAFVTFGAFLYRAPKETVRERFRAFNWITAAQASFTLQAFVAYLLIKR